MNKELDKGIEELTWMIVFLVVRTLMIPVSIASYGFILSKYWTWFAIPLFNNFDLTVGPLEYKYGMCVMLIMQILKFEFYPIVCGNKTVKELTSICIGYVVIFPIAFLILGYFMNIYIF